MKPIIFTAIPHDEIKRLVFQKVSKEANEEKNQRGRREFSIGIATIIIAFIALLLFPQILLIAGIVALAGVFSIFAGFSYYLQNKDVAPDTDLLKGKIHNMRNAGKGNCPICDNEIIVDDCATSHDFQCSVCTGNLHVQNYEVVAR